MIDLNKIVKNMSKKWWNIFFLTDIFEMIDPECKPEYRPKLNKIVYQLKAQKHIIILKSWVYVVPESGDTKLNEIDLIEKYYLKLLKKYITAEVWTEYYISGLKSLEFHLKDFSLPEKIVIINRKLNKKIQVGNYEILFRTISGTKQGKKLNLYAKFSDYTKIIEIESTKLRVSCLEMALLETALVTSSEQGLAFDTLNKALKKYRSVLDTSIFYEIVKYKYIMSCNRLKEIAKPIDTELYQVFLDIIKINGGLFIGEGLRGF